MPLGRSTSAMTRTSRAGRINSIHRLFVQFQTFPIPVAGIREIDSSFCVDSQIVRAIQALSFVFLSQNRQCTVRFSSRDPAPPAAATAFACQQTARCVKLQSIGTSRGLPKDL